MVSVDSHATINALFVNRMHELYASGHEHLAANVDDAGFSIICALYQPAVKSVLQDVLPAQLPESFVGELQTNLRSTMALKRREHRTELFTRRTTRIASLPLQFQDALNCRLQAVSAKNRNESL